MTRMTAQQGRWLPAHWIALDAFGSHEARLVPGKLTELLRGSDA